MCSGVAIEICKRSSIIGDHKNTQGMVIYEPKQMLGIIDLRS